MTYRQIDGLCNIVIALAALYMAVRTNGGSVPGWIRTWQAVIALYFGTRGSVMLFGAPLNLLLSGFAVFHALAWVVGAWKWNKMARSQHIAGK